MIFPDCRNDDYYNVDFLEGQDHEFVRGYDWAIEAVDNLFDNPDSLTDGSDRIEKFLDEELPKAMKDEYEMDFVFAEPKTEHRSVRTYGDFLRMKLLEWLEKERNTLVTSLIDNMDEDIFNALRNKVLKENEESDNPKEYYDTRAYIFSGKKETDGPSEEEEDASDD